MCYSVDTDTALKITKHINRRNKKATESTKAMQTGALMLQHVPDATEGKKKGFATLGWREHLQK